MRKVSSKLYWALFLLLLTGCSILNPQKNIYKPELISVKGGTFLYGDFYDSTNTDAIPVHLVDIDDFKIGKYEITFEQFDFFAEQKGFKKPPSSDSTRGNRAVVNITWDEALAFCKYYGMRLPTEAEWEYAARSGGKKQVISGVTTLDSIYTSAITVHEDWDHSQPVGTKKPNQLGLYDMSGNVFEWIGQYYQFYSMPDRKHSLDEDAVRIIRGGSFTERIATNRTYWRTGTLRDVASPDIGFRCADD